MGIMKFNKSDIGSGLFEAVTFGLYGDNINCVREYIQNGVDAGAKNIWVYTENMNTLTIRDDGEGMNEKELKDALKVGISNKTGKNVGWRGIGIWSGVATCDRLVIITKKRGDIIYRIEVDCKFLRLNFNPQKPLEDTLTEATGDPVPIQLGKGDSLDDDQFTEIRLESIGQIYKKLIDDDEVRKYLSITVPAPLDDKKFLFANEVNHILENNEAIFPNVNIEFNGKKIYRYPDKSDIFISKVIPKVFTVKDKKIAVGWLLQSDKNKAIEKPYGGICFKLKGFTIGDDSLIRKLYPQFIYHPWQFCEIHVVSDLIRENSARNGFEYNNEYIEPFLIDVANFLENLQDINHYQSDRNVEDLAVRAQKHYENGEFDEAKKDVETIYKKEERNRKFPDDPSLKDLKPLLDKKHDKGLKIASQIGKALENMGYNIERPAEKKKALKKRLEKQGQDPVVENKKIESLLSMVQTRLSPEVRNYLKLTTKAGKFKLVISATDPLKKILEDKLNETPNKSEILALTQKAYGWGGIQKATNYNPQLVLDVQNEARNYRFGAMVYTVHDMLINSSKHEIQSLWWLNQASDSEREILLAEITILVDFLYRLIEKSRVQNKTP